MMGSSKKEQRVGTIGVFDSGFGGLATLRACVDHLPEYDYVYLGDTARAPYGERAREDIERFTREAVTFLFDQGCELVVLACNTASSEALRVVQQTHVPSIAPSKNVLGVLIPAAEEAVAVSRNKRIGVLATRATVESNSFVREITKIDPSALVFQQAAPLLVPAIEAGEYAEPHIDSLLREYLDPLLNSGIDTLVLGCTHYELIRERIATITGPSVAIVAESEIVAEKLADYLRRHSDIAGRLSTNHSHTIFTTGDAERFDELGSVFFGEPLSAIATSL